MRKNEFFVVEYLKVKFWIKLIIVFDFLERYENVMSILRVSWFEVLFEFTFLI